MFDPLHIPHTLGGAELVGGPEAGAIEASVGFEGHPKKVALRLDVLRVLEATVPMHLAVGRVKVGELDVITSRLQGAAVGWVEILKN